MINCGFEKGYCPAVGKRRRSSTIFAPSSGAWEIININRHIRSLVVLLTAFFIAPLALLESTIPCSQIGIPQPAPPEFVSKRLGPNNVMACLIWLRGILHCKPSGVD